MEAEKLKLSLEIFWDTLCSKLVKKNSATTRKNSNNSKAELSKLLIDTSSFISGLLSLSKKCIRYRLPHKNNRQIHEKLINN